MIKIANFESVLEIAFGLNALFFIFELVPRTEERLRELVEKHGQAYKEKVTATASTESFPVGFVISAFYPHLKRFMEIMTVTMSLILLGFLIYAGFLPEAEISSRKMWILLFFSFGIRCVAIRICIIPIGWLKGAIKFLERQTAEAREAKSNKEMGKLRNQDQENWPGIKGKD